MKCPDCKNGTYLGLGELGNGPEPCSTCGGTMVVPEGPPTSPREGAGLTIFGDETKPAALDAYAMANRMKAKTQNFMQHPLLEKNNLELGDKPWIYTSDLPTGSVRMKYLGHETVSAHRGRVLHLFGFETMDGQTVRHILTEKQITGLRDITKELEGMEVGDECIGRVTHKVTRVGQQIWSMFEVLPQSSETKAEFDAAEWVRANGREVCRNRPRGTSAPRLWDYMADKLKEAQEKS